MAETNDNLKSMTNGRAIPLPPNTIKVLIYDLSIEPWVSPEIPIELRLFGSCHPSKCLINYDPAMIPAIMLDTILHEIAHFIFWAYKIDTEKQDEEHVVEVSSTAWTQIYRDNPHFLEWISKIAMKK